MTADDIGVSLILLGMFILACVLGYGIWIVGGWLAVAGYVAVVLIGVGSLGV